MSNHDIVLNVSIKIEALGSGPPRPRQAIVPVFLVSFVKDKTRLIHLFTANPEVVYVTCKILIVCVSHMTRIHAVGHNINDVICTAVTATNR